MNEVIDLVDDGASLVDSLSSPSSPINNRKNRKRRRVIIPGPTTLSGDDVIDLEASPSPSRRRRDAKMPAAASASNTHAAAGSQVIDLETAPKKYGRGKGLSSRTKKKLEKMGMGMLDDYNADDDVVEILSPGRVRLRPASKISSTTAAAAAAKAPKSPQLYDLSTSSTIDRIREVFPLVSSHKIQSFLTKSSSYVDKSEEQSSADQVAMQIVMTVLSEYPLGENIPDEAFAAAAVGGHIDAAAISNEQHDDDNDGKMSASSAAGGTGKQKIAQLECNCCFVDYPFEEMVSCRSAGHLFCKTCLQKHTEQRVFGLGNLGVTNAAAATNTNNPKNASKALEICCMHSSGCTSGFHEGQLRKALSEKVLKKYDEMQYAAVIEQANTTGDISRCPKCNFIAFAEKTVTTFHCPQCSFKSCRECGEEAHLGIKCDEVESKTETDGRTNVEEAMTQALVRTCPRPFCRKKFLKTDGCNKMTCACGAFVCYVCRKEIPKNVAYAHFCQTPHCNHKSCGKCALYADVTKQDEKRVKEAAKKAAKKQKTDVDVESLMKNPNPPPAAARRARGGGGYVPGHNGYAMAQYHQQMQQWNQQVQQINQQLIHAQQALQQRRAQQRRRQNGGGGGGGNNGRRRNRRR